MRTSKKILLAVIGLLSCFLRLDAQNCADMYQRAQSLRKSKNYENYAEAINWYQRAKNCDSELTEDCNKWIQYCRDRLPFLEVPIQEVIIPYQGGDKQIDVKANYQWNIEGVTEWCNTEASSKSFVVQCREANNSTRDKVTSLLVKSGSLYKTVRVVQKGRPEYLEVSASSLSFPAQGTEDEIAIESNVNWSEIGRAHV